MKLNLFSSLVCVALVIKVKEVGNRGFVSLILVQAYIIEGLIGELNITNYFNAP